VISYFAKQEDQHNQYQKIDDKPGDQYSGKAKPGNNQQQYAYVKYGENNLHVKYFSVSTRR
jgi:hypothetical protein